MEIHCMAKCGKFVTVKVNFTGTTVTARGFEPMGTYEPPPNSWLGQANGGYCCSNECQAVYRARVDEC